MSKADYVLSQDQTRAHHCHWPECEKQVPPAMWGCREHWLALPLVASQRNLETLSTGARERHETISRISERSDASTSLDTAAGYAMKAKTRKPREEAPFRNVAWKDHEYQGLDAGIRFAVKVLHAAGLETCQSCQGGKGHAYSEPTVDMVALGNDTQGFAALAALQQFGLPVADVAILWRINNGLPYEKLWRITFSRTMEDRADEKPNFVWYYKAQ